MYENLPKTQLIELIRLVFVNNKECGDALNMSEQTFSKNLNRRSQKFLRKLEGVGVAIPRVSGDHIIVKDNAKLNKQVGDKIKGNIKGDSSMSQQIAGAKDVKVHETHHHGDTEVTNTLVKLVEGVINTQAETLREQASSIKDQSTSIRDQSLALKKQAEILEQQVVSIDRLTVMLAGHDRKNQFLIDYVEKDEKIHQEIIALLKQLTKVKR